MLKWWDDMTIILCYKYDYQTIVHGPTTTYGLDLMAKWCVFEFYLVSDSYGPAQPCTGGVTPTHITS